MWRNFPLDRFVSTFIMWRNFPLDNMSRGEFLHMTNFFSTDAVCGVCDKYQVCFRIVHNYVVDILYYFTENHPRAVIGRPVFVTDL